MAGNAQDVSQWFLPTSETNPNLGNPILQGNDATYFIEYRDYYRSLSAEIEKTSSKDHFIYFVDWQLVLDTWMDAQGGRKTFKDLLQDADSRGVQIRSLLYGGQYLHDPVNNGPAVQWISALKNGGAYLDMRYLITGSHHQKMAVIRNSDGVVGFCGGMDIAEDRQLRDGGPSPPIKDAPRGWHDVQIRIAGPAAVLLWRTFNSRWIYFQSIYNQLGTWPIASEPFPPKVAGKKTIQVVRTFGNGTKHSGLEAASGVKGYTFAPTGEMTIYKLLCRAIQNTTSTIYLEDQYLVESERMGTNQAIPEVLADTLSKKSFKRMVILTPGAGSLQNELCQVWQRRTKLWKLMGPDAASKVKIYSYRNLPESPYLMHSKTWIFDDAFAVVSSANCNRRSYSHDSEIGVGIADPAPEEGQLPFPKDLRIKLWLKHLNLKGPTRSAADVSDFEAGAALWDASGTALEPLDLVHPSNQPPDQHVSKYLPTQVTFELPSLSMMLSFSPSLTVNLFSFDREWDNIIDPDGS
jgi:phosphatidylserine/phosphatidylglycerophosphate/cardiolipin synthase-like enzyme